MPDQPTELWSVFQQEPTMPDEHPMTYCICNERRAACRELLLQRINYERDMVLASQKVVAEALLKQAEEYGRRLDGLNNNMKMIIEERRTFLTLERHETFADEYRSFRDTVNAAVIEWKTTKATLEAVTTKQIAKWSVAVGVLATVLSLLINHLWR